MKAGPASWLLYISSSEPWPARQYRMPTLRWELSTCSSSVSSVRGTFGDAEPRRRQVGLSRGATCSRSFLGDRPRGGPGGSASSEMEPRRVLSCVVRKIMR